MSTIARRETSKSLISNEAPKFCHETEYGVCSEAIETTNVQLVRKGVE